MTGLKRILCALIWIALPLACFSQPMRFAFYNAENVFDTLRNPAKEDAEFTPQGAKAWDGRKYRTKIDHTAQVIADLSPGILGMAEVENDAVLSDLVKEIKKKSSRIYAFIRLESGDERGIDPALLYDPVIFSPVGKEMLRSPLNQRGILYVKGTMKAAGDTLHVFVNHWTSRYMGQKATEAARVDMARLLAQTVDSILAVQKNAKVIAFGDLNDTPDEKSVQYLQAYAPALKAHNTVDTPTYYYKGEWLSFDQIFTNFAVESSATRVFTHPYMLEENGIPLRTFSGPVYKGGYSDHLPVFIDLFL